MGRVQTRSFLSNLSIQMAVTADVERPSHAHAFGGIDGEGDGFDHFFDLSQYFGMFGRVNFKNIQHIWGPFKLVF